MIWRISRGNSIIKWQGYRVSASRLAESNFRYTHMVQLTQTRAVSTSLPVLCLIVVGRKLNRPPFEQSAHLLARRRRVHASIACEVAVRDRADERRSGKRFEQPQHDVGPGLADPCEHVSKRNPHRFEPTRQTDADSRAPHAIAHHGGAAFRLLVSIPRLLDDIEAHGITTELEKSLHDWMLFRLRPSSRVDRQYEQFALSDEGCEGVQQLHPGRQRLRPCDEGGMQRRRGAKRYRQPEQRDGDDQQRAAGRQPSAFSEHPRHSSFKGVVECLLEGPVADVASEPDPLLAHSCAPCVALRTGHGETLENPLQKNSIPSPTNRAVSNGIRISCSRIGKA